MAADWQLPRVSRTTLAAVVLAHAGLLAALLIASDTPAPVTPPRPLTVSLIVPETQPPTPALPKPQPLPPKPQAAVNPNPPPPLPPPPVLAAKPMPAPTPAPVVYAPAPRPVPLPEVLPPPSPPAPPAPPVEAEAPKPAPPAPVGPSTPPRPADYLINPKPPYPALSRRLGEEGTVRLNILVNPDGSVARLELAKSSGFARLDQSAMDTVRSSWKFEPARQGGKPLQAWVIVPIQFTLGS